MESADNICDLLQNLLDEVRLLTVQSKAMAIERFRKEFLTSDLRAQMYSAFDGERTLTEISKEINCKINTLQIFAQTLVENDLVDFQINRNSRIIKKSIAKIAIYYATKDLEDKEWKIKSLN